MHQLKMIDQFKGFNIFNVWLSKNIKNSFKTFCMLKHFHSIFLFFMIFYTSLLYRACITDISLLLFRICFFLFHSTLLSFVFILIKKKDFLCFQNESNIRIEFIVLLMIFPLNKICYANSAANEQMIHWFSVCKHLDNVNSV